MKVGTNYSRRRANMKKWILAQPLGQRFFGGKGVMQAARTVSQAQSTVQSKSFCLTNAIPFSWLPERLTVV
ncbi:hypothetical protein B1A54_01865 [Corynebacterium diphtheriae]|nr:hypothetical protein CD31A_0829 [Corynebacterium diphtheriae 31A]AEX78449.1 hypothetical protein CDHC03_0718 [Corynebacterium diphtheriae HC03]ARB88939.1 hypothetical protein A6J36_00750 [Corynebacterium diphtheriae]OSQ20346.1 hypothetical protein B1A54_01865 [Corynebacterium diphtheriae]OWM44721.1 hypothetical protein BU164_02250 [Corynebacterium diphtheriae]